MNISSIIVNAQPESMAAVRSALAQIPGVEIQTATEDGKLIVTIETETDGETTGAYDRIGQMDGVMSVALVFHQYEPDPDIEVPVQAGREVTPEFNGGSK